MNKLKNVPGLSKGLKDIIENSPTFTNRSKYSKRLETIGRDFKSLHNSFKFEKSLNDLQRAEYNASKMKGVTITDPNAQINQRFFKPNNNYNFELISEAPQFKTRSLQNTTG